MGKLQGLIFDLDGTLVDSAPELRMALNSTLAEKGRRPITIDEIKNYLGDGMTMMLQRAFAATGAAIDDQEASRLTQNFINHYRTQRADASMIYPHVVDALDSFQKDGIKLGLCTNKHEGSTHRLLAELDLARFFTFVAGGDTFPVRKPHPGHVTGVIEKLGVPAASCIMIGDSSNDVLAAQGAGIPCIVVTHGYGFDYVNLGGDALIDNFAELREAVGTLIQSR